MESITEDEHSITRECRSDTSSLMDWESHSITSYSMDPMDHLLWTGSAPPMHHLLWTGSAPPMHHLQWIGNAWTSKERPKWIQWMFICSTSKKEKLKSEIQKKGIQPENSK
ncbi:hypothetical protein BC833DRAFT_593960, partial [Globomyces pollinis-pini]